MPSLPLPYLYPSLLSLRAHQESLTVDGAPFHQTPAFHFFYGM